MASESSSPIQTYQGIRWSKSSGRSRFVLETRPVYHQRNETIRGRVFCNLLALVLRKELDRRLAQEGHCVIWADIKQDLKSLQEVVIENEGESLAFKTGCIGSCGKVFRGAGIAMPLPFDIYKRRQRAIGSTKDFSYMAM